VPLPLRVFVVPLAADVVRGITRTVGVDGRESTPASGRAANWATTARAVAVAMASSRGTLDVPVALPVPVGSPVPVRGGGVTVARGLVELVALELVSPRIGAVPRIVSDAPAADSLSMCISPSTEAPSWSINL
jgi:hypothetical protein